MNLPQSQSHITPSNHGTKPTLLWHFIVKLDIGEIQINMHFFMGLHVLSTSKKHKGHYMSLYTNQTMKMNVRGMFDFQTCPFSRVRNTRSITCPFSCERSGVIVVAGKESVASTLTMGLFVLIIVCNVLFIHYMFLFE